MKEERFEDGVGPRRVAKKTGSEIRAGERNKGNDWGVSWEKKRAVCYNNSKGKGETRP